MFLTRPGPLAAFALYLVLWLPAVAGAQDDELARCEALGRRLPDLAIEHCDKVLSRAALPDAMAARVHVARAVAWRTKGDVGHALSDLDQAVAGDPANADARVMRAVARHVRGDDEGALSDLDEAVRLRPGDGASRHARGDVLRARGELRRAVEEYSTEISLAPSRSAAWHARGIARLELGELEAATLDLQHTAMLDPNSGLAQRDAGLGEFVAGGFARAHTTLEAARQRLPADDLQVLLWRYLAGMRAAGGDEGREATRAALARDAAASKTQGWPRPLVEFYLGSADGARVRAAAAGVEEKLRGMSACEAEFFIAEFALAQGRPDEAAQPLAAAREACPPGSFHAFAAKADLGRIAGRMRP
jgi:lipoprotein NlpI